MKLKPYTRERDHAELLLESILGSGNTPEETDKLQQLKNVILSRDHDEGYLSQLIKSGISEYKNNLANIVDNELQKPQILQMYDRIVGPDQVRYSQETNSQIFVKAMLLKAYIAVFVPGSNISIRSLVNKLREIQNNGS